MRTRRQILGDIGTALAAAFLSPLLPRESHAEKQTPYHTVAAALKACMQPEEHHDCGWNASHKYAIQVEIEETGEVWEVGYVDQKKFDSLDRTKGSPDGVIGERDWVYIKKSTATSRIPYESKIPLGANAYARSQQEKYLDDIILVQQNLPVNCRPIS